MSRVVSPMTSSALTPRFVFFDVEVLHELKCRIVIEVFHTVAPETSKWLCKSLYQQGCCGFTNGRISPEIVAVTVDVMHQGFITSNDQGEVEAHSLKFKKPSCQDSVCSRCASLPLPDGEESTDGAPITHDGVGYIYVRNMEQAQEFMVMVKPNLALNDQCRIFGRVHKGMEIILRMASVVRSRSQNSNTKTIIACGSIHPTVGLRSPFESASASDRYSDFPDESDLTAGSLEEVIMAAQSIKSSASYLFRKGAYDMAKYKFNKAVNYLNWFTEFYQGNLSKDVETKIINAVVPCLLDSAACKLKLKDYDEALVDCNEALDLSPQNPKGLYRRGQVYHGQQAYNKSLTDLYVALKLAPNNKAIKAEIVTVEGEMQIYNKQGRSQ